MAKKPKTIDLFDYAVDVATFQLPDTQTWSYVLNFMSNEEKPKFDMVAVHSRVDFSTYEDAFIAGIEIIETLGFDVEEAVLLTCHEWNDEIKDYESFEVSFDGENFRRVSADELTIIFTRDDDEED